MPNALATLISLLIDSLAYGMTLFLISVGLTITLGVMRVVNLAHSTFAMIGGYLALYLMQAQGVNFYAAVPLAVVGTVLVGALLERTLYRWVYRSNDLGQLLMTIGMAFIATAIIKNLAGPQIQSLTLPASLAGNWQLGPIDVSIYRVFLMAVSGIVAALLWFSLEHTTFGASLRASVDNPRMARCVGINVPVVFASTFAIGCGLAALGGALGAQLLPLEPYYGLKYLVLVLIVVAVGGLGSLRGSFYAALLLGVLDTLGRYYLPAIGGFVIYISVLVILLLRPRGLVAPA
ncbi:branched-chain amino acid ABC transporter permease [Pigmentiphaga litoralis]|uniref:Branched-chain amino acid transport system permease protein n=1 Tax=Pigmentiphaga litoralis TaxID=516702 RepID=A0A7Y9LKD3_9BURK|nr:branched-chain amino acid ABC transporter permease [Pigmentiphaga litoralis]NYE24979.1 branched-chain amino acid transport system permease protein [Pigmentiphaga litoralis]NYE81407.1 branched-chain amino acid transport system permease protein [Pigmentiphaga litoralis]